MIAADAAPTGAVDGLFGRRRLTLIAGPCVVESRALCLEVAQTLATLCAERGLGYVFKASYDKANRTSGTSFRGPGVDVGLATLAAVRAEAGVPVLTDVHGAVQVAQAAAVVDVLQIPAFLCRQTDLLVAAAQSGRPTNIKKGQFVAPADMRHAVAKFVAAGGRHVAVTERGTCFGYRDLVVDMRSLPIMRAACERPVIFDATHSVQRPGAGDGVSGGDRSLAPPLARAAAAVGIDGLFCEVHPDPDRALSDGPNSLRLADMAALLDDVVALDAVARRRAAADATVAAARR